ncbi:MAG: DUF6174 domain-containing protein [Thiolinea sp.]
MHIQNYNPAGKNQPNQRTEREQNIPARERGTFNKNPGQSFQPDNAILQQLLQLIQQLLQQCSHQPDDPKQPPQPPQPQEPKPVELTPNQQSNLRELLNIEPNAPFVVQVLDEDGSGTVSVGDTAVANGGITGGEIARKTLTADDVAQINQTKGSVPQELTDNLQKWQSFTGGPDEFVSYTTQQSCFCPQDFTRPINITESNGQITSAVYADTNEQVPDNVRDSLQTVDQRFEQLQNAYENGAATINVQYDPQFGYPTSVFIDQSQMIADEEVSYTISDLGIALP